MASEEGSKQCVCAGGRWREQPGYHKILGVCEGAKEGKAGWSSFLRYLKERGLKGVRLFVTDACLGLFPPTSP